MKNERSVEEPDCDDVVGLHLGTSQHSVEGNGTSDGTSSHSALRVDAAALPHLFETPLCSMTTSALRFRFSSSSDRPLPVEIGLIRVGGGAERYALSADLLATSTLRLHHRNHLWSLEIDFDFGERRRRS
jgi:hypothetical protein